MARSFETRAAVIGMALATLLGACVQLGGSGSAIPSTSRISDLERRQAQAVLDHWATAVASAGGVPGFVPVGDLTGQIGDWEIDVGENNKIALMAGSVTATVHLPVDEPGDADIRWADGTTTITRTIAAEQALLELQAGGTSACSDCVPLKVTGARLSRANVMTSRGPASAPAWEFSLDGTKVLLTRIAVASGSAVTASLAPLPITGAPTGISIESATRSGDGSALVVRFVGAPDAADKPCGEDYTAEALESDLAAVVIVTSHPNGAAVACALVGAYRTATVRLAKPLGARTVLEYNEGRPVPVVGVP